MKSLMLMRREKEEGERERGKTMANVELITTFSQEASVCLMHVRLVSVRLQSVGKKRQRQKWCEMVGWLLQGRSNRAPPHGRASKNVDAMGGTWRQCPSARTRRYLLSTPSAQ